MHPNFHNLMEDIVLQYVDTVMESHPYCRCEICRNDVIAYALNHLPPRYVVTDTGRMLVKLDSYAAQFRTDVVSALGEAVQVVGSKPRHT